ncbi:DUF835 domain-containing protein [Thermococcus sp. MV5]|uniref:DUF835 domain-containing protein n=1 Tax=Thermococcus sp. MV5 TaxID=1638272 RepID=UPI001F0D37D2|nr:DUF835 domain-containing protein [Thermococcus sp. MV5]
MGIVEILLSEEFNEGITLLINIITIALALKFRKPFKERYMGAGKFYDALLIATVVWFIAECLYAPAYFSDYFTEEFIEKSKWIADNIWIIFQLLFLYAFASLFEALVSRYTIEVIKERSLKDSDNPDVGLTSGSYIVTPGKEKEIFLSILQERPGFIISRTSPDKVKTFFGVKKTPIMWLTKVECEQCIRPTNLEYLGHLIVDFLKKDNIPKAVLIEGLEYLALENSFERMFKFLSSIKDYAVLTNSIVLLVISPEAWNKNQWAILRKEFPVIE